MIKKIYLLLLLIFAGVFASNANVNVTTIGLNSSVTGTSILHVTDTSIPTKFIFSIGLGRSILPIPGINYADGTAKVTLVYRVNPYSEGNEIAVSKTMDVSNADYGNGPYMRLVNIQGELPANITGGSLLVKLTYYNTDQNKTLTVFASNSLINIQYTMPNPVPVYMWTASALGEYCLSLSLPTDPKWSNVGAFFYAHERRVPGSFPVYEYLGHVNDENGNPSFPYLVRYYSTSHLPPTEILPGNGSGWDSNYRIAFYAFLSPTTGTIPVYCYRDAAPSNFLYMNTGEVAGFYQSHVAFHAYATKSTIPPTLPTPPNYIDVLDLVTYPARRSVNDISNGTDSFGVPIESNTIGVKLPGETLTVTWTASKLSAGNVRVSIVTGPNTVHSVVVGNTGSYTVDFASLQNVGFYTTQYQVIIQDLSGNKKQGRSGVFRFHKDHPNLWEGQQNPNGFQNSSWVFPPHDGGSGAGELKLNWMSNEIAAQNVSIDLLYPDGTFYKRLTASTPNNGSYLRPYDSSIPLGGFYQFKITSVENPLIFGYSELHHHYID